MNLTQFSSDLKSKIEEWLSLDKNDTTRSAVEMMINDKDENCLRNIMMKRLLFGTAGLRGRMGPGYSCMNDLVIIQTSQGLGKYLVSFNSDSKSKGIAIGYDSRHNSQRFAQLAASAFLSCGIRVYLLGKICPTPFVPFTVMQYGCAAGVMVTASHNPKEDNGYKVYWNNGAQIIPPHDINIQQSIEANLEPMEDVWNLEKALASPLISDPIEDISEKYFKSLSSLMLNFDMNAKSPLKFTLTSMHGVSHNYMVKAFEVCKFEPFFPVKEQMDPDPEFPTVKFPNPEEGKSALDLSFATAAATSSSVILANDPDADRLAVAEKLKTGDWKVFTGNEEGALLGWWSWYRCRKLYPNLPVEDIYMIASTVSSKILRAIAKKEGFNFIETLTGFKWMGNKAYELLQKGKTVIFAFEEAIGFMCGSEVLDKDGISAAVILSELATYLHSEGMTLNDKLQDIYKTYGFHACNNGYYICHEQPTIAAMFNRMRNFQGPNSYPRSVGEGGKFVVRDVRDLTVGFDSSQEDKVAILPISSESEMVTFEFTNDCVITLRTSGTEPKIKYYSEICGAPQSSNWDSLAEELADLVKSIVQELMEPEKNQLIPKSD